MARILSFGPNFCFLMGMPAINNLKYCKIWEVFPKGWRGSEDLGQDPKFFRTFVGGVLESQKYSLTPKYTVNEYSRLNVYHCIGRYEFVEIEKSGTYTKEVGCI